MRKEKFALFIDGAYLFRHTSAAKLDFRVFRSWFENHLSLMFSEAYYFDADTTGEREKFHLFLQRNCGIRVKNYWTASTELYWPSHLGGKKVVHPETGEPYVLMRQKAVDVSLGYFLSESWHNRKWTHLVLVAGDGDFVEPITRLVEGMGVELILVGDSSSLSTHLISYASEVFHLDNLESDLMTSIMMKNSVEKSTEIKPDLTLNPLTEQLNVFSAK